MKAHLAAAVLISLGLIGCKKPAEDRTAIRTAVVEYLAGKGMTEKMMDIDVKNVTFHGQEADALVAFRGKGSPDSSGFQIPYSLKLRDGKWVVAGKKAAGMGSPEAHTGAGAAPSMMDPHAMPPQGGGAITPDRLPPSGGQMKMPPGHPAVPRQ